MAEYKEIPEFINYTISKEGDIKSTTGETIQYVRYTNRPIEAVLYKNGTRYCKSKQVLLKATYPELFEIVPSEGTVYHVEGTIPVEKEYTKLQARIRQIYVYDLEEGCLLHKNTMLKAAQEHRNSGYKVVTFEWQQRLEHTMIILYMLGEEYLQYEIDHVDHDRSNNKWNNLRVVCRKLNSRNLSKNKTNSSGYTGVNWHTSKNKWRAYIMVDYKQVYLGLFKEKEDAIAARKAAEIKYGFHNNHGK